jgi:hypothetical protein
MVKKAFANELARPLGVELEIAVLGGLLYADPPNPKHWHWEHDGTITPGGSELVGKPAGGDNFLKHMGKLIDQITTVDPSPKVDQSCGYHCHVQAVDLGWWELRRLVRLWCGIEPDIFQYIVLPARRNNRYCMPMFISDESERRESWQFTPNNLSAMMRSRRRKSRYGGEVKNDILINTTGKIKQFLIRKLYGLDINAKRNMTPEERQIYLGAVRRFESMKKNKRTQGGMGNGMGCRYSALNLHSYFFRHTVEFRMKEGTLDPTELLFFPLFCGWLVESAIRLKDTDILSISSLKSWCVTMRAKGFAQTSVIDWVEERIK